MSILFHSRSPEPTAAPAEDPCAVSGFRIGHYSTFEAAPAAGAFYFHRMRQRGFWQFRYYCPCGCMAEGDVLVAMGFRPEGGWFWDGHWARPTMGPDLPICGERRARLSLGVWHLPAPGTPPRFPL